jgi:glutathione peroxidase
LHSYTPYLIGLLHAGLFLENILGLFGPFLVALNKKNENITLYYLHGSNTNALCTKQPYCYEFIRHCPSGHRRKRYGPLCLQRQKNPICKRGFTPQYEDLEKMSALYKDKLVVIVLPCNQFMSQEPGSNEDIKEFCSATYGVTFPMTDKIEVKGPGQHPLYKWLTNKALNGKVSSSVKWNFQKYLVDENGALIDYFYSTTKPMSDKITKYL